MNKGNAAESFGDTGKCLEDYCIKLQLSRVAWNNKEIGKQIGGHAQIYGVDIGVLKREIFIPVSYIQKDKPLMFFVGFEKLRQQVMQYYQGADRPGKIPLRIKAYSHISFKSLLKR